MQTISVPTEKGKTMREKLMEIVCDALEDGCVGHCNHPHCNKVKNIADNLISNGVRLETKQATSEKASEENKRWIPVTEQVPSFPERVLVWLKPEPYAYTTIDTDRVLKGKWVRWQGCVTHWMHLPEPPQEK